MNRKALIAGSFLLAGVLLLAVILGFASYTPIGTSLLPKDHGYSGSLQLTLKKSTDEAPQLYKFAFRSQRLVLEKNVTPFIDITRKLSPDGKRLAVATGYEEGAMTIDVLDLVSGAFTLISKNETLFKREPAWSSDGKYVAYLALPEGQKITGKPQDWSIYIANADGSDERFLSKGTNPIFAPDSSALIFLKNRGLYRTPRGVTTAAKRVWPIQGATSDMKLTLSPDGKKLAWSNRLGRGGVGELVVFDVVWKPFALKPIWEFAMPASHAAFSPDSAHIAVFVDDYHLSPVPGPQVVIVDLVDGVITPAFDLNGFDASYVWLTEWTAN